ncbi:hypothetical protein GCM10008018_65700 [Paenibacillus marchantiophytorum]|uniref:Uncharacterized protein n=1 Tax=Paenibacillus marchantiophytorum TaxID=1619310 RepID=A0ABQ1FGB3_9BACL|nr:hypothetical protein GCM10008018_65700 [Paenibacillus marchantiophytorum]
MENRKETIVIHRPEELNYMLFATKSMKVRAVVDNHLGQIAATSLHEKPVEFKDEE